jgi:signal transduction histidine kinase
MKKYLLKQWVGISFIHWLIGLTFGIYLATFPFAQCFFYKLAIALWVLLSSLILSFWTIYLLSWAFPAFARTIMPFRMPVLKAIYRLGQATTLLILLIGAVRLLPGVWTEEEFFHLPDGSLFWIMQSIAISQGLHHFFYKFTSGSPSRLDGLLDQIERGKPIDWQYPVGGSIGVELRRLRRFRSTSAYKVQP